MFSSALHLFFLFFVLGHGFLVGFGVTAIFIFVISVVLSAWLGGLLGSQVHIVAKAKAHDEESVVWKR